MEPHFSAQICVLHGLPPEAVAEVRDRMLQRKPAQRARYIVTLVISCAVMSRAPDRRADTPKSRMVEKRGKPAWFRAKQVRDRFGKLQIVEAD